MDNTHYKVCDICGNLIEQNNIFNIKDKEICKSCIEKSVELKENYNSLATFVCSLIPGVAHIYLGKKQKGLFLLSNFLISISLWGLSIFIMDYFWGIFILEFTGEILSILTTILSILIYVYSFFDATISAKYIKNNIYLEDKIDKLSYKIFKKKNKKYLEEKIIDKRLQ